MNAPTFSPFLPGLPARRLRILCAEDHPQIGDVLVFLLTRRGHNVHLAHDGSEAWEVLRQDPSAFDLVVTDHQMPTMCGLDLVGFVRQSHFAGRIVVYTSSLKNEERARYALLGVDAIVEKSSVATHLILAVEGS